MSTQMKKLAKLIMFLAIFVLLMIMPKTYAETLEPTEEQKIQFVAVDLEENNGKDQLIVEAWIKNLDFKGIDLRLQYDNSLLEVSDMTTNEIITIDDNLTIPSNFQFSNNFSKYMDMFEMNQTEGELRIVFSKLADDEITESDSYLVTDENIGSYIHITEPVLIGKFSFQVGEGEIVQSSIALKTAETSPTTGVKVNINGTDNYQNQSLFEFILDLESKNAFLSNIVVSSGSEEESNYKVHTLTPEFNKETYIYNVEILEMIEKVNVTVTREDETATAKIKKPKKDEDGNTIYEQDGTTIVYEEIDMENLSDDVTLNKLGEPETIIEIKVTAEDGVTTKTYQVTIKRPFGTIKGTIQLGNGLRESMQASYGTYVEYIASATLYKSDLFDWDGIVPKTASLNDLDLLEKQGQAESDKDDGSYTIYVIPGEYDLILERLGFLQSVVTKINIAADEVIDIGNKVLIEGDTDRTGIIDLDDIVAVVNMSDTMEGDGVYDEIYDFGQKGFVGLDDLVSVVNNSDSLINIETYSN